MIEYEITIYWLEWEVTWKGIEMDYASRSFNEIAAILKINLNINHPLKRTHENDDE